MKPDIGISGLTPTVVLGNLSVARALVGKMEIWNNIQLLSGSILVNSYKSLKMVLGTS